MNEVRFDSDNTDSTAFDEVAPVGFAEVGADQRTWGAGPVSAGSDAVSLRTVVVGILYGARLFNSWTALMS